MGAYEDGYNEGLGLHVEWLELHMAKLGFGTFDTAYYVGRYRSGTSMYDIYDELDAIVRLRNISKSDE